jgi:hypothetical protein
MARDEARHAGFINDALREAGVAVNLGLLTKKNKYNYRSTFQLLVAAVFITSILYFNFSKLNTEPNNFSSESPIISTILLNEEITDEYIIDYLTDKIAVNEIYIPK